MFIREAKLPPSKWPNLEWKGKKLDCICLGQNSSISRQRAPNFCRVKANNPNLGPPLNLFRAISEPVTKGNKQIHKELTAWTLIDGFDFAWKPRAGTMHR
jgi:hypothetical protein